MATTKKYTRPRAVDLGLSTKKTPTQARETGGKVKPSKVIAPTGRGKSINVGKALTNIAKAIGKVATTRIIPDSTYKKVSKNIGKAVSKVGGQAKKASDQKTPRRIRAVDLSLDSGKPATEAQEMGTKKVGYSGSKMRSAVLAQLAKRAPPAKRKPKFK